MKQMFRAVTLVLLVGGWTVAGSAVHLVRTPGNWAILPKDRLTFHDTYLDTRKWTLADDQTHPTVVARLVHLGRTDLLAHTLPAGTDPQATFEAIAADQPTAPAGGVSTLGSVVNQAAGQVRTVVDLAKAKAGKI